MNLAEGLQNAIEYIEDNLTEDIRIKDVALKYGYDSPDSFSREHLPNFME